MCLFRKLNRPLDFVLPVCFITNHAKYLRRIKWEFVNMFPLSRQELGRGMVFLVGSWNILFYDILSATWLLTEKGLKKNKKKKNSRLFLTLGSDSRSWWHGAFVLGQQNYISGINDYRRTVQAKFWPFLVYLLKESDKMLWKK